ncbi:hypothetical protein [Roseinatronobacter sp.]|uniref:hypothetical protein n=1 Tax=Roseinatronobacter sp. TaxID=1945755 RepID=UPI0025E5E897|nr:hypothetical protein [Rhodobaca sp.]
MPSSLFQTARLVLSSLVILLSLARFAAAEDLSRAYLLPELFEIMAAEGRNSVLAEGAVPLEGRALADFERDVSRIYDQQTMHDAFLASLMAEVAATPEVLQDALEFAGTDLGKRVLRLEISARDALLDDEVDEIARLALYDAREARTDTAASDRLAMIRERVDANDLVELNVSLGLNTSYAYYQGMMSENAVNGLDSEQLLFLVWAQEPEIRADIEDWIESYFMMAYKPLSDDELEAYIEYASTPLAQAFNRAMFRAFETLFNKISLDVGRALGRRLNVEDI